MAARRIVSGTDRLLAGIVGCGDVLPEHTRAWTHTPGCELRGFYDIDPALAERAAASVPGSRTFGSLEALLAECDIVALNSPAQVHKDAALEAIDAGRHVLIEKPVVMTVPEWIQVRDRAAARGVCVSAVHQQKFSSHVAQAKGWIDAGRCGPLVSFSWDFLVDPATDHPLQFRNHWVNALPGGRWFEVLPHLLYLLHMFAGRLEPGEVTVLPGSGASGAGAADDVAATLVTPVGLATLHLSTRSHLDVRHLRIQGAEGLVDIPILRGVSTFTALKGVRGHRAAAWAGLPFLESVERLSQWVPDRVRHARHRMDPTLHTKVARAFAAFVRGQGPTPSSDEEIEDVTRCCEVIGDAIEAAFARQAAAEAIPRIAEPA